MSPARIAGPAITLVAVGLGLLFWHNLGILWGTPIWEFRYLAVLIVAMLLLTIAERATAFILSHLSKHD